MIYVSTKLPLSKSSSNYERFDTLSNHNNLNKCNSKLFFTHKQWNHPKEAKNLRLDYFGSYKRRSARKYETNSSTTRERYPSVKSISEKFDKLKQKLQFCKDESQAITRLSQTKKIKCGKPVKKLVLQNQMRLRETPKLQTSSQSDFFKQKSFKFFPQTQKKEKSSSFRTSQTRLNFINLSKQKDSSAYKNRLLKKPQFNEYLISYKKNAQTGPFQR